MSMGFGVIASAKTTEKGQTKFDFSRVMVSKISAGTYAVVGEGNSANAGGTTFAVLITEEAGGGGQISIDESHNRIGFVPLDLGSNYGSFQMANYRANISIRGNQNTIFVGVTNSNTRVSGGQVVFNASALLLVDGNVIQKQVLVNGSARFGLPNVSNVSLTVKGGWNVYFDSGGASVPIYHPIFWPFSLNFKDDFKLK